MGRCCLLNSHCIRKSITSMFISSPRDLNSCFREPARKHCTWGSRQKSRESSTRKKTRVRGAGKKVGACNNLSSIFIPPRKPQETAKCENCHRKQEMCQPFVSYLHRPRASDASVPGAKYYNYNYKDKITRRRQLVWTF